MTDNEIREQLATLNNTLNNVLEKVVTGFAATDQRFETVATKEQLHSVYDLLDKNISEHERQEQERAAMAHQLNRHESGIQQLAAHTGASLRFE